MTRCPSDAEPAVPEAPRNPRAVTRGRPFQPGNPGKQKGTRHRVTRAMQELLDGEAEALTRRAVPLLGVEPDYPVPAVVRLVALKPD